MGAYPKQIKPGYAIYILFFIFILPSALRLSICKTFVDRFVPSIVSTICLILFGLVSPPNVTSAEVSSHCPVVFIALPLLLTLQTKTYSQATFTCKTAA